MQDPVVRKRQSPTVAVEVELAFSDLLHSAVAVFVHRAKKGLAAYAGAVLALSAVLVAAPSEGVRTAAGALLAGLLLMFAAAAVFLFRINQVDFRRASAESRRLRYVIGPSGMQASAAGKVGFVSWLDLWDAVETRKAFLLSVSPQEQYVIPKRFFSAPEDSERLAQYLREAVLAKRSRAGQ